MDNFQTYELQVLADDRSVSWKKGNSIAFSVEAEIESDNDDIDDETLTLLTKNFNKILKGINRRNQGQTGRSQGNHTGQTDDSIPTSKSNTFGTKSTQSTRYGQSRDFSPNEA